MLDVSISTVSKALNDSHEISPATKERIREAAKLYNYQPNRIAVNLKSEGKYHWSGYSEYSEFFYDAGFTRNRKCDC